MEVLHVHGRHCSRLMLTRNMQHPGTKFQDSYKQIHLWNWQVPSGEGMTSSFLFRAAGGQVREKVLVRMIDSFYSKVPFYNYNSGTWGYAPKSFIFKQGFKYKT